MRKARGACLHEWPSAPPCQLNAASALLVCCNSSVRNTAPFDARQHCGGARAIERGDGRYKHVRRAKEACNATLAAPRRLEALHCGVICVYEWHVTPKPWVWLLADSIICWAAAKN